MWPSNETLLTIPPSPNWYLSQVFDCHQQQGLAAYGAGRNVVIAYPNPEHNVGFPQVRVLHEAHKEKVTCISWSQLSKTSEKLLLCTAGDDGYLKVWDAINLTKVCEHNAFENQKIVCLSWSRVDSRLVFSGTDAGNFTVWDVDGSTARKLHFGKLTPTTAALCPHKQWIAIIAAKGGLLYICNIRDKGTILHKIRAHEDDICGISFSPRQGNVLGDNGETEILFATAGKDRFLKVWSLNEAKCVTFGRLQGNKSRSGPEDKRATWIGLHWIAPDMILSSGLTGELLSWDVSDKMKWSVVHKLHARGLFNISSSFLGEETLIWTSAQDRNVIVWPLSSMARPVTETLGIPALQHPWLQLATLGGFVYSLSISPVDSAHVALGVGDGTIRLWNAAARSPQMTSLWNGIKGKVTAVCWHPTDEGLVAFGTDEGRVGVFETLKNKPAVISKQSHKGTIYSVTWGKIPGKEEFHLFSLGGGQILIHRLLSADSSVVNFNTLISSKPSFPPRSELSFSSDYSQLAVGNEDGSVEIYNGQDYGLVSVIVAHKKLIQSLKWHPHFITQSDEKSPCANWLAVASNETAVKVYDIVLPNPTLVATLKGHKDRIVSLAWDPHSNGQLVSASYDGTVQVWDVLNDAPVANYSGHVGRPFVCDWSYLEPGTVMSGGEDFTLRQWRVVDQKMKDPGEAAAVKRSAAEKKKEVAPVPAPVQQVAATKKKTKLKSLFPVSSSLEVKGRSQGLEDCRTLARSKGIPCESSSIPAEENPSHLGFFGDEAAVRKLLKEESQQHVSSGNYELAAHLELWTGNLEPMLRELARKKQLSDWLVSLAPQVSKEFWMDICKHYAEQLSLEGDIRKASSYLVAANMISDAVDLLLHHNLFREAISISKSTGMEESKLRDALAKWAAKSAQDGNIELSAKCHVAADNPAEAARVLARRADCDSLRLASNLARAAGLDELATAYFNETEHMKSQAKEANDNADIAETE